eukprot:tig00000215_g18666.t1
MRGRASFPDVEEAAAGQERIGALLHGALQKRVTSSNAYMYSGGRGYSYRPRDAFGDFFRGFRYTHDRYEYGSDADEGEDEYDSDDIGSDAYEYDSDCE